MYQKTGSVRLALLLWTAVLIVGAGVWWWLGRRQPKVVTVEPRADVRLEIANHRPRGVDVAVRLTDVRGRVRLWGPKFGEAVEAKDAGGGSIAIERVDGALCFDAAADVTVHYVAKLDRRTDAVLRAIDTPHGGCALLGDVMARVDVDGDAVPCRFEARLPTGWVLHRPPGLALDGTVRPKARAQAIAWTHAAVESLLSKPHSVAVTFVGASGAGDPALQPLGDMVRWIQRDILPFDGILSHRVLLFDLPAPHLRLELPSNPSWSIVERGPMNMHRLSRIARGFLHGLPTKSATPAPKDDWYPGCLGPYARYRAAEEGGAESPVPWLSFWQVVGRHYRWIAAQNAEASVPWKGAMVLTDLAETHVNALSVRLIRQPALVESNLDLHVALALQMNLAEPNYFERARGRSVYLDNESVWRQDVQYADVQAPAGATGDPSLTFAVASEMYAYIEGCGGCPTPGTLAQWTARLRALTEGGAIAIDGGDWAPFFLVDEDSADARAERIRIARAAARRAGLSAMVIGPGELGWGRDALAALLAGDDGETDGVPLISANVAIDGGPRPTPWVMRTVDGRKVAIVGVTDIPRRRYRLSWFEEALRGIDLLDPVAESKRAAKEARKAGATAVVAVGAIDPVHVRMMTFSGEFDAVISTTRGFDRPARTPSEKAMVYDRSGMLGGYPMIYGSGKRGSVERIDVMIAPSEGRAKIVDFRQTTETLADDAPADEVVQKEAEAFRSRFGQ